MDSAAIQRATERLIQAAERRPTLGETETALDRARLQIEALAQTASELQATLPDAVGSAVRAGLHSEALPIGRQMAEVRGLSNQLIRRLERIETDLAAERNARVEDLGLLVDLIVSGWRAVDERLARVEETLGFDERREEAAPSFEPAESDRAAA
jgi:hypothetical protein